MIFMEEFPFAFQQQERARGVPFTKIVDSRVDEYQRPLSSSSTFVGSPTSVALLIASRITVASGLPVRRASVMTLPVFAERAKARQRLAVLGPIRGHLACDDVVGM